MKKIELTEELIAAVARQGVTICGTEAEIVLAYIKVHGYELLTDDDYKLYLHDESAGEDNSYDEPQTVRDIVELCKELNEEMLLDSYSEESPDYDDQLELRKDTLILETLLTKARAGTNRHTPRCAGTTWSSLSIGRNWCRCWRRAGLRPRRECGRCGRTGRWSSARATLPGF